MKLSNFFVSIFPDKESMSKLARISAKYSEIFTSQVIPVLWIKPEKLHITVLFVGQNINFIHKWFVNFRLKRYQFKSFEASIGHVKLGISKNYRELVYLTVEEGADELRDLVLGLEKRLHVKRQHAFIPHITLGRVSKDLSDEEFKNLTSDITKMNEQLDGRINVRFHAGKLEFVESDLEKFKIIL
jgi:2'-5' RNA ligase